MPSTYSNLKIQLMATGENTGTWGNVTNENLGTALEQAIVETATVTFSSANVTLTLSDSNSRQDARALRLNLTGTTGGARDLIVPAIQKPYLVNNGTADTITVKVSGQTGIAVPAGKSMLLYNNGTDVGLAFNRVVADVVGNVTGNVTGTASNATVLQTARNIQISGNVTAANVSFDGSAAVNLDVTAINAAGITSGTLGVARGGTGATTLNAEAVVIGNTTGAVKFVAPGTSGNVLSSNGTSWVSVAPSGGFTIRDTQTFNNSGTWTKPGNATSNDTIVVMCIGGGGGGSGGRDNYDGTFSGGAGGGVVLASIQADQLGATVSVTVGSGGNGASTNGPSASGNAGGGSSFGNYFRATGGAAGNVSGAGNGAFSTGGSGQIYGFNANSGSATVGTTPGGSGRAAWTDGTTGAIYWGLTGGGGGMANVANNVSNYRNQNATGLSGTLFGAGGNAGANGAGNAGTAPGGGGGSSIRWNAAASAGAGAAGQVIVYTVADKVAPGALLTSVVGIGF